MDNNEWTDADVGFSCGCGFALGFWLCLMAVIVGYVLSGGA